jgi:hypothetical protein
MNTTIAALIAAYKSDKVSGYHKIRPATRQNYDSMMRRIEWDHGDKKLADLRYRDFLEWHQKWAEGGKVASAHGLIGMVRTLIGFGATILEDQQCERLCGVLHRLRCEMPKSRSERLTAEQANMIRTKAHELGLHSIALAQAIQFECMLRQKDVIGEWVDQKEKGTSEVLWHGRKWLRGLRWSEIDESLVLRHVTSKRQKEIEVDLWMAPMVLEEFNRLGDVRTLSGPIIVNESTGRPYEAHQFRRTWRMIARACGIPDRVFNMDSRAGAISEATDAGADLEHVRHAATHSDIKMTSRYSRGSANKIAQVQNARVAYRKAGSNA